MKSIDKMPVDEGGKVRKKKGCPTGRRGKKGRSKTRARAPEKKKRTRDSPN